MRSILLSSLLLVTVLAEARVRLGHPFADNMILQRDMPVRVWGAADPGERVTVSFAGQTAEAVTGAQGRWRVELDPMPASKEPRTLTVSDDQAITNVLVGEVWFASGQSNMELGITGKTTRYRDEQGRLVSQWTRRPCVRFARCPNAMAPNPAKNVGTRATWKALTPGANNGISALAWYYALELHDTLDVPVGVVVGAWGGSPIEPWIPAEGYVLCGLDTAKEVHKGGYYEPSVIWNAMISPWSPMAMRGFIWYQGCSNAKEHRHYGQLMHALYKGWSAAFQNPKLHLNFVQLAPWGFPEIAQMQEAQAKFAADEPNATMAVVNDRGNIGDIHPADKETVAKRLAALALKHDYGYVIKAEAPSFRSATADGDVVEVSFDHADFLYDYPDRNGAWCKAFELAGEDGKFVPAEILNYKPRTNARGERLLSCGDLEGSNVCLRATGVANPKKIRYLHTSPWDGQMFNEVGLPLMAFEGTVVTKGE